MRNNSEKKKEAKGFIEVSKQGVTEEEWNYVLAGNMAKHDSLFQRTISQNIKGGGIFQPSLISVITEFR